MAGHDPDRLFAFALDFYLLNGYISWHAARDVGIPKKGLS